MKSFYYLATPYRAYPGGKQAAFEAVTEQAALLLKARIPVFAPIVHSHPIDGILNEKEENIYLWLDGYFMKAAEGIIVCELAGWDKSEGVDYEIRTFKNMNKQIIHMTPNVVPLFFNSFSSKVKAFIKNEH